MEIPVRLLGGSRRAAATAVAAPAAARRPAATDSRPILRFRRRRDRRGPLPSAQTVPAGPAGPRVAARTRSPARRTDPAPGPTTTSGCTRAGRTMSGERTARRRVNLPRTAAELRAVSTGTRTALVANELDVLDELFWPSRLTVRYGVADVQHGGECRGPVPPALARQTRRGACTTRSCRPSDRPSAWSPPSSPSRTGRRAASPRRWVRFTDRLAGRGGARLHRPAARPGRGRATPDRPAQPARIAATRRYTASRQPIVERR